MSGLPGQYPGSLDMPQSSAPGAPMAAPAARLGASQNLTYQASNGTVVYSNPVGNLTQMIRICVPPSTQATGVRIAIGQPNPVVTAASALMVSGIVEYFKCSPGDVIGAISNDTNPGSFNIVECRSVPSMV